MRIDKANGLSVCLSALKLLSFSFSEHTHSRMAAPAPLTTFLAQADAEPAGSHEGP